MHGLQELRRMNAPGAQFGRQRELERRAVELLRTAFRLLDDTSMEQPELNAANDELVLLGRALVREYDELTVPRATAC